MYRKMQMGYPSTVYSDNDLVEFQTHKQFLQLMKMFLKLNCNAKCFKTTNKEIKIDKLIE